MRVALHTSVMSSESSFAAFVSVVRSMLPLPCKAVTAAQDWTRHAAGDDRHAAFDALQKVLICLLVYVGHQAPCVQYSSLGTMN